MKRRDILKTLCALSIFNLQNTSLGKSLSLIDQDKKIRFDVEFWNRPRRLYIYRQDNHEKLNMFFYNNGAYDHQAYKLYCWIFRDIKSNNAVQYIDIALLNLLSGIQEWARLMGSYEPIYYLNSGYRTFKRNQQIESAAKNSMHVLGKAADGKFSGISLSDVNTMASYFAAGGIGMYSSFIHLDTSKFRKWGNK